MIKPKQFTGKIFPGIIYQAAQRVTAPDRGIVFDRQERYIVNTPFGQMEIRQGDWVVEASSGSRYVIKPEDINFMVQPQKKWWKVW